MSIELAELLAPISPDRPCGEDISFNDVYDRVREARRSDDPNLRQGEWQTDLKTADWRLVIRLATDVLSTQSKDLQMAVWLGEALISTEGVGGARQSVELLHGMLDTLWDGLFPELDGDDAEERAAKLAWYNIYASDALRRVPLSGGVVPMTLLQWQDSREVDNLARQNQESYQAALEEGRLTGEAFDKAMQDNSAEAVLGLLEESDRALATFEAFKTMADTRLGRASPSLAAVEDALKRIRQVVAKTAQAKGIGGAAATAASDESMSSASSGSGSSASAGGTLDLSSNSAASKDAALRAISDIAAFFRRTEPHNPVAFMLEKAVVWANTPLDAWLNEVVRDSSVLASIRDRVGISGE
ncbi:type VI secretion system protein TssA [Rhodanobacter sp. L36]|uniref:type VI secretion system protein TssA n=1 Tax=Rhodanobacter sp. L36 TaxID=1747221 RepID=UPI00131CDBBB|nr:type VI secretion system protein TssA [Rhodanobacter sp. L36]